MSASVDLALMQRRLELDLQAPVGSWEKELLDIKPDETIFITEYVTPSSFLYVTLKDLQDNGALMRNIESQLPKHCQGENYNYLYHHDMVIVRFKSEYLHGSVFGIYQDYHLVISLDYGYTMNCKNEDLWELPSDLFNIGRIEIRCGALAGVTPYSGNEWSEQETQLLHQKIKEAQLLIFQLKYPEFDQINDLKYGQLLIKSNRKTEPLLNAASYLIENQCARLNLVHFDKTNAYQTFKKTFESNNDETRVAAVLELIKLIRSINFDFQFRYDDCDGDKELSTLGS